MKTRFLAASAAAALAVPGVSLAIAPAVNLGQAQYSIGISGVVPVICRASVDAAAVAPAAGTVQLGSLHEFCNSPNGYRVHADYSPSLAKARLIVDGKPVPLGKDGSSVISHSNRAAIGSRQLELDLPAGVQGGTLSFRIEPL